MTPFPIDVENICFIPFTNGGSPCNQSGVGLSTMNSDFFIKSGLFGAPLIDPVLIYEGTLLEWGLVQNC